MSRRGALRTPRPPVLLPKSSGCAQTRQNRPDVRQQFLKPASGTARTWVVATELLEKLLFAVHHAMPALHARFGREALATLTARLETMRGAQGS